MQQVTPQLMINLNLKRQFLDQKYNFSHEKDLSYLLNEVGCIQLDALNALTYSHNLFFWSRMKEYKEDWFYELYQKNDIFEFYGHALSVFPISDYPYNAVFLKEFYKRFMENEENKDIDIALDIYNKVKKNGPMTSRDFNIIENDKSTNQWETTPVRWALNQLWRSGLLGVKRNSNFIKIFDVVDKVIPNKFLNNNIINLDQVIDYFNLKALKSMGIATEKEIQGYFRLPKNAVYKSLDKLERKKQIEKVKVKGFRDIHYILKEDLNFAAASNKIQPSIKTFLSPFDNLIWDRERALKLFNIDYRLESYIPKDQRKFGYYGLPILINDRLVGIIDLSFKNKEQLLKINQLTLFNKFNERDNMLAIKDIIEDLYKFLNGKQFSIDDNAYKENKQLMML